MNHCTDDFSEGKPLAKGIDRDEEYSRWLCLLRQILCGKCRWMSTQGKPECRHTLVPITSRGEECPYYEAA